MSRSADRPPPRPTREELLEAMARLSLTPGVAAERWRVGRRTLQRMCAGEQDIPIAIALHEPYVGPPDRRPVDVLDAQAGDVVNAAVQRREIQRGLLVGAQPDHQLELLTAGERAQARETTGATRPDVPAVA